MFKIKNKRGNTSPIIIMGMHCSGTGLLSRLLEQLGLFVGTVKDQNNEAIFFRKLNIWIMNQCGASWDFPESTKLLLEDHRILELVQDYLKRFCSSPQVIKYLGIGNYFKYGGITKGLPFTWGWKDPKNIYTLPIWLNVFPNARVVYIERHGVDVAKSLCDRASRESIVFQEMYEKHKNLYWMRPLQSGFSESIRTRNLKGGLSLWREYVDQGRSLINHLDDNAVYSLRYEDLLNNPMSVLPKIAEFCGLDINENMLSTITSNIKRDRCYAYRENQELVQFAVNNADILSNYNE